MWVELFACSAFVAFLIPFFDSCHCYGKWIKGRRIPCLLLSFGSPVLEPLYACTGFDRNISSVLAVTTAPLRTREMSSAFSAPRLWYPRRSLSTRDLLCFASFDAQSLAMACVLEEVDHLSLLSTPVPPSLGSCQVTMAYGLRENRTSLACSLSDSRQSP
jgi:hypothetical protein